MRILIAGLAAVALAGCGALIDRATTNFAHDLEQAVIDYDAPLVVERGLPAFLLILEARLNNNPDDAELLGTLSTLTATYSGLFVDRPETGQRMTTRALRYARRAACAEGSILCDVRSRPFLDLEPEVAGLGKKEIDTAYILGSAWVSWIAAHSSDYAALADLPKAELLLGRVAELDPGHDDGAVWLYLAVLNSQRPPAAGGRPDLAREYYQRAREISGGRNLLVDVFMADEYARLMFDRELYVELLEGVVEADPEQQGFTLANHIAQQRARHMLERTAEIFD